ncbi:MAG: family 78 glycoside hydrolase catalytic domain [Acidobacteriota bacterium]
MVKTVTCLILLLCAAAAAPPADESWDAKWITASGAAPYDFGVVHFRKTIELAQKPARFVVHVSADNRFRLYVNGEFAVAGPAQGDLRNWRYETIDIAPHMKAGANTLAAVVWNGGEYRPMAQISHRTGFVLAADGAAEKAANSDASWKSICDRAYQPVVYRDNDERLGWQYYVAGATERVDAKLYPWGWEKPGFDDSAWQASIVLDAAAPAGVESHQKWQLVPSPVPPLFEKFEPSRGAEAIRGVEVPAHTKASFRIDHGMVTTGYPTLTVSGGAGSEVRITYAEALYDARRNKGNRDEFEGKRVTGVSDIFLPDGGQGREFRPLWVRSFRFVQLDITTSGEPLRLGEFRHYLTGSPVERAAVFESGNADLQKIWETSWRTAALGAQDVLVSDLAWERIPYVGDAQIHALAWLATTGDDRLVKQTLEQVDASRAPFGLTQSRYPAELEQYTPLYSLVWVNMVHDFWMHGGSDNYIRQFLPGIAQVLGWYERQVNEEGMIGPLFHLDFIDSGYDRRRLAGAKSDAIHTLYFAWALGNAADIFDRLGPKCEAERYRALSAGLKRRARAAFYDAGRGLFADTAAKTAFSQHANILAVLSGAVPADGQRALLERSMKEGDPLQLYFRFFLGRALRKTGLSDRYIEQLEPWREMIARGMTTFGEQAGEPRSECHPWSASPSYELLATVAGIEPASPGFRTVRIAPALGPLKRVHAKYPHPLGAIEVACERQGARGLKARIALPPGLKGTFVFNGQTREISGEQELSF